MPPLSPAARPSRDELFSRVVAFDTVSSKSNLALVDFICELLDRPGVRLARLAPSDNSERVNLLAEFGPEANAERYGLVLSGHLDVVPADEPEWQQDPFTLTATDDSFSARGAADMKGFISLAVSLGARVDVTRLRHPLVLLLTRDEEIGTIGARDLVRDWGDRAPLPRAAVIGEPTSMQAVRLHKGHARFSLELFGKSAHSGYPQLGENAIELGGRALAALDGLRRELAAERAQTSAFFPAVPFVPLNVGTIHGGAAINVVPDRCKLEFGLRALPGMDTDALFSRVFDRLHSALPDGRYRCELLDESPPLAVDPSAPIHRRLAGLLGERGVADCGVNYATDGGWLTRLGLDCVICGPGSIEVAHRPNEFVPRAELDRAEALLEQLVVAQCFE